MAEFVSVDGVMDMNHRPGSTAPFWDDAIGDDQDEQMRRSDALLLGLVTYEGFAQAWPPRGDADPFTAKINAMPKYVASSTLTEPTWNVTVIGGVASVPDLIAGPGGNLLVNGSGQLVAGLAAADLVDEWRLMVHPVVLCEGLRLFPEGMEASLELVSSITTNTGVAMQTYRRAA